ncbi:IclR family transcriptional regulator [Streptomyces mutabilis]|uniref:IclR family transcriptional regulator n=1 Tax=Streptomyces mutabilis TaxID=67332 RepID=A0A086MR73_9ACTN|nr:IclR family transcriptional regulator C-terminal domain-containing protein [Streptomyces mutabilis]KFG71391.1 IclR family transcriptional regulator [Streptomyces mutabilis]
MSERNAKGSSHTERVFRVQQAFIELGGGAQRLTDIARTADLDDSTVSRILTAGTYKKTFVRAGRGLYQLGAGAADLGLYALSDDNLSGDESRDVLQNLRARTDGGLVFLYLKAPFGGAGRQCFDMAVGDSDLIELGMTPRDVLFVSRSLRTGASGRTILAFMNEAIQKRVAHGPIPDEAGPGVLRDADEFLTSLAHVREHGFALGRQECMANWNSIAAPVIWDDTIQGAVLLLKPAHVMPKAPPHFIDATVKAAAQLSQLGGGWPTDQ